MTAMAEAFDATQFDYPDLRQVDPEYTKLPEDVYTLRVLKLTLNVGKNSGKPYLLGQFAVTRHNTHSARRLSHFFNNILDPGKRDMKDLAKLAKVTGVPFTGTLPEWVANMNQIGPEFNAPVKLEDQYNNIKSVGEGGAVTWSKEPKIDQTTGEVEKDNRIDFRNAQPAN
jgi:hypothetical protein